MTITVTFHFANATEAEAHFRLLNGTSVPKTSMVDGVSYAKTPEVQLVNGTAESVAAPAQVTESAAPAAVIPDTAPATAETAPSEVTEQMVREEFVKYVQRGGGRTAATGKTILEQHGVQPVNGVVTLKGAKPEQLPALLNAFRTA